MNTQCETCGRQLPDDSFSSECWRCSLGATHPVAPFVWFALFVVALAIGWRWGMFAVIGLMVASWALGEFLRQRKDK